MKFAAPTFLHLLWLLIPVAAFLIWAYRRRKKGLAALVDRKLLPELLESVNPAAPKWKGTFFVLGLFFAILALARPQWGFQWEEVRQRGNDVFIALDCSKSMLAEDIKPNRLERAKREVKELLPQLKGDRVGLIPFAGTAFVLCPLTLDAAALRLFLEQVDIELLPQGGTAIAQAIRKALASFPGKEKKHKVLILITDGEDLEGGAAAAAERAKEEGVSLYVVGVGTAEGAPIPVTDETGARSFLKDKQGQTVLTKLDLATLNQLNPAGMASSLTEIYEKYIVPMEKKELESVRQKKYDERFQWPLFLALLFLLLELLVPERNRTGSRVSPPGASLSIFCRKSQAVPRRDPPILSGRLTPVRQVRWVPAPAGRPRGATPSLLILFILVILYPTQVQAATAGGKVKEGNKLFAEEKWDEAASRYTEAQLKQPGSPEIYFNLGNALYKQGKFKEARQVYEKAKVGFEGNPQNQQKLLYNFGNCDYRLGQLPQAVADYEKALELDPKDEDARTNYEFVKKLLEQLQKAESEQKQKGDKEKQAQEQKGEQQEQAGGEQEQQPATEEKKQAEQAEKKPGEMSQEEAELLLQATKEEELSGKELRIQQKRSAPVAPEKDW